MSRIRRFSACLLAFVLMLGLFAPPASGAELYFTSINDHLAPLTADTMPIWSGGVLYVPYTVFETNTNGNNDLDLNCSYNRAKGTFALFNLKRMLSFDLNTGECWNEMTQEPYSAKGILRNNIPYLSLAKVCEFFGLEYSYTPIPTVSQGYLVRIKNDQVVLSDARFIDAASDFINRRLREYNQSLNPTPQTPSTPTVPSKEPEDSSHVPTYLAIRNSDGLGLPVILDTLENTDTFVLFLLTPEVIAQNGPLVRRILGSGHSIGIWADRADLEEVRQILREGNRLLKGLAYTRTTVAYVPKELRGELEDEGWVCWNDSFSFSPSSSSTSRNFADTVLKQLSGRTRTTYLALEGGVNVARILPMLLRQLENSHFDINIPLETRL